MDNVEIKLGAIVGGKEAVMPEIIKRISGRSIVTLAMCMHEGVNVVKTRALAFLREMIRPALDQAYVELTLDVGEYSPEWVFVRRENWNAAMDDKLEVIIEPYAHVLSSDWTGRHVVDSKFAEPGMMANWIDGFANEIWRNITYLHKHADAGSEKTPAQIMSSVGIVGADFLPYVNADDGTVIDATATEVKEELPMTTLPETIAKLHMMQNMYGRSVADVQALLDNATDADDGLALSGISQLGGDMSDVTTLRQARATMGVPALAAYVIGGNPPAAPAQPVQPAAPVPAQGEIDLSQFMGGVTPALPQNPILSPEQTAAVQTQLGAAPPPAKKKKGEPVAGSVPAQAIAIIKEHTGLKSEEVGAALGVSRGTFDNYAKGKAALMPDSNQLSYLHTMLAQKIALLQQAAALLPPLPRTQ